MPASRPSLQWNALLAALAVAAIDLSLYRLHRAQDGAAVERRTLGGAPATVFRPASGARGPVVLIAHGFAGSQQIMQSFALTFARGGFTAVTFDLPGHGRNPAPLTGSITELDGATLTLVEATKKVAEAARPLGDGRLAVLGHSMASDVIVRVAQQLPGVSATLTVSMFSPAVTATSPPNLLVVVGDWEETLKQEALRVVGLAAAPAPAKPSVTYGDPARGTGRRAAFAAHVEHASVLFSQDTMRESIGWLDQTFGVARTAPAPLDDRGPWILLLLAGVVLLARPLSLLLPRVSAQPAGAGLGWRKLWLPLLAPMVVTPLVLRVLPTSFLPVLVGDYLAVHFAMYGALTALCLAWLRRGRRGPSPVGPPPPRLPSLLGAAACAVAFGFVGLVWPLDRFVTSFVPGPERAALLLVMLVGTLAFFLSDEWLTRGAGAARGAYAASKAAFVASLALAVALDFERLFFLVIIVPVITLFFLAYGLFSHWAYRQSGHPFVAGIANAVAFAWAIGVSFPLLAR
jgi:dienelactone hydrolase